MKKEELKLSKYEAESVLSSLGYVNKSKSYKEWRGSGYCHHGSNKYGFSFHYQKGVALCHTKKCFNSGTDIYGVVEHSQSVNFYHAKKYVEKVIGRKLPDNIGEYRDKDYYDLLMQYIEEIHKEIEQEDTVKPHWVNDEIVEQYRDNKCDYWNSRGITQDTLDYFKAGYDKYQKRVTIPIYDINDKIVSIKRRVIEDGTNEPKYKHDSYTASDTLFNLNNVINLGDSVKKWLPFKGIIVIEGNIDVMMSHQMGWPNVVGTGSNSLTLGQAKLLEKYTHEILIIPDEDQRIENNKTIWRGESLIKSTKEYCGNTLNIYISRINPFKDIGSMCEPEDRFILSSIIDNRKKL